MADYQNWLLLRRMTSQRQVLETMTEFWENHFNVPVERRRRLHLAACTTANAIRARALGSFESLLQAVTVHPAMGIYLGNAVSDKEHPNENQGRELLELHTVGLGAGYTEANVVDSARILTGWRVDMWDTWKAGYNEMAHSTGRSGCSASAARTAPRTAGRSPATTCTTSPTIPRRPSTSRASWPRVRQRRPAPVAGQPPGAGLPRARHADPAGAPGAGGLLGVR